MRVETTGCHRSALFLVMMLEDEYVGDEVLTDPAFDFDDQDNPEALMSDGTTPALTKVCAIDDSMGLWPRFEDAMMTGESFEPFG